MTRHRASPGMLVYCDQSPGAAAYAEMWMSASSLQGKPSELVTDQDALINALQCGPWTRIVVVSSLNGSAEPIYAAALREYSASHRSTPIWLLTYHNAERQTSANEAGVTAISLWQHGVTAGGYARAGVEQGFPVRQGCVLANAVPMADSNSTQASVEPAGGPESGGGPAWQVIIASPMPYDCGAIAETSDTSAGTGWSAFSSGSGGSGEPGFCTKCVNNSMVQLCFQSTAWPQCEELRLNLLKARDDELAYINNVLEPFLLGRCNATYSCWPSLLWACRRAAYFTTGMARAAVEAVWLAAEEERVWIACPAFEAQCVNDNSCLVPEWDPCPAAFPNVADTGLPCYPEDLASLGCQ